MGLIETGWGVPKNTKPIPKIPSPPPKKRPHKKQKPKKKNAKIGGGTARRDARRVAFLRFFCVVFEGAEGEWVRPGNREG